jgi:hypothetical protein
MQNRQNLTDEQKFTLLRLALILISISFIARHLLAFGSVRGRPDSGMNLLETMKQLGNQITDLKVPELDVAPRHQLILIDFSKANFTASRERILPVVFKENMDGYAMVQMHDQTVRANNTMELLKLLGGLTFEVLSSQCNNIGVGNKFYDNSFPLDPLQDSDLTLSSEQPR